MALSNNTIVEVRTTGSDNNGGGFVTGASGIDYSQQNAAQYALSGLTTAAANAIILTASAAADMVGNLIQITGGTNFITGIYQITAVSVGVSITVDRNCSSAAGAAGTANVGGALATIAKALAIMTVTGMQCYVKATATYSIATGLATSVGIVPQSGICRVIGYTTARGDGGRPTIQATAAITTWADAQGGFRFENFILDGNTTGNNGFSLSGVCSAVYNCIIKRMLNYGVSMVTQASSIIQTEITTCGGATDGCAIVCTTTGAIVKNCYIHDNTTAGCEVIGSRSSFVENIFANNSGANSDGIRINAIYGINQINICNNIFYNNGRDGFRSTATYSTEEIAGNIFVNNAGIGLNTSAASPVRDEILYHHNAFYNNTGGARSGNNAGVGDVTLTGVPFTNAGGGDYSLNNVAGQGAALRALGFPGAMVGGGTGYKDIGPLQHQDNPIPVINQIINQYITER